MARRRSSRARDGHIRRVISSATRIPKATSRKRWKATGHAAPALLVSITRATVALANR